MWIIYGDKGSGAFAAEAALAEAGAPFEIRPVALKDDEQRKAEFLAVNPSGKIPVLALPEGGILTETLAMLITIAERYPAAGLLPHPSTSARAQALRWLAFLATEVYPLVEIEDYPARFAPEGAASEALRNTVLTKIRERLSVVERAAAGPWLLTEGFSAADIYAAMFISWSAARGWREAHAPKLLAMSTAVAARPRITPVWRRHFTR